MFSFKKQTAVTVNQDNSDIDVTPMLDVVFIMLIFFIVTATFIKESGFGLNKPNVSHPNNEQTQSIVLEVDANDEFRIQNRVVMQTAIKSTVVRLLAENPESSVVVRLDPNSSTRAMVQAVDGIRAANVDFPTVSLTNKS